MTTTILILSIIWNGYASLNGPMESPTHNNSPFGQVMAAGGEDGWKKGPDGSMHMTNNYNE